MRFSQFLTLHEAFDTVSDFLLNPEHRYKTWDQLMKEFEASGGSYIGGGRFGTVYDHPSWPYVVKVFNDPFYLRFARFAYRNPHPCFPKFFGPPQRIVPFYTRGAAQSVQYIVRVEKLIPVKDQQMLKQFITLYDYAVYYLTSSDKGNRYFDSVRELFQRYPQLEKLTEAIFLVQRNIHGAMDIHTENIMQRQNGDLVLTDPLWEGTNPYADARRAMEMETDPVYDEPPSNIVGGKMYPKRSWKDRRPRRQEPQTGLDNDEIPF
jgi:hypothetical protein